MISPEARILDAATKIIQYSNDNLKSNYKVLQGASMPSELRPGVISVLTSGAVATMDSARVNQSARYPIEGTDVWTLTLIILITSARDCPNVNRRKDDGMAEQPLEGKESVVCDVELALKEHRWRDSALFKDEEAKVEYGEDVITDLQKFVSCHLMDNILTTVTWEDTFSDKFTCTRQEWDIVYRRA